ADLFKRLLVIGRSERRFRLRVEARQEFRDADLLSQTQIVRPQLQRLTIGVEGDLVAADSKRLRTQVNQNVIGQAASRYLFEYRVKPFGIVGESDLEQA